MGAIRAFWSITSAPIPTHVALFDELGNMVQFAKRHLAIAGRDLFAFLSQLRSVAGQRPPAVAHGRRRDRPLCPQDRRHAARRSSTHAGVLRAAQRWQHAGVELRGARAVGREAFRARELMPEPAAGIAVRGAADRDAQSAHQSAVPARINATTHD